MDKPFVEDVTETWIGADEPPAYEVVNGEGRGRVVLTCDHASARIPRRLGTLGVSPADRKRHVALDIGAAAVARRLSRILDAPLVLCGYSRLVVDCNRPLDQPEAFVTESEDVRVPGNEALGEAERAGRAEAFYWPYHDAVNRVVGARTGGERPPVLVSVHSYTPVYHGQSRPWHIGVLSRLDRRLAELMLGRLGAEGDLCVGDNDPYRVALDEDYTIPVHGEIRGLPHALLEIRQDLVAEDRGALDWAERMAGVLADLLGDSDLDHTRPPAPDIREPRYE
jgi:predicted N-formylglutamate amidohydrolase